MPDSTSQIGKTAEQEACVYLVQQGLILLELNYRSSFGEIDLIMKDQNDIVFVEVRKRTRLDYGHAIESITQSKVKRLIKTGSHYLQKKRWLNKINARFDIVTIQTIHDKLTLDWIKNAFYVG